MANIATTGDTTAYISEVRPLAHTLWRGDVMTSCGGSRPTPPATSVGLKLNEQNSWVSAIQYVKIPLAAGVAAHVVSRTQGSG